MPTISGNTVYGVPQKIDGVDHPSFKHVITDSAGGVEIVGSRRVDPSFDVEADLARVRARVDEDLIQAEVDKYTNSLTDDVQPAHQTKNELKRRILLRILKCDSLERVMDHIGSVSFLLKATDAQLKSQLSIGDAAITKLRTWQAQIQTHKQFADNYEALI